MATSPVQNLLGAVRRRLWRGQFVAGVRLALWGSAGLMLLAVAVHLAVRPVPAGAVLAATGRAVGCDAGAGRMASPLRCRLRTLGRPSPGRGPRIHHLARDSARQPAAANAASRAMARTLGHGEGARRPAPPRRRRHEPATLSRPLVSAGGQRGTGDARADAAGAGTVACAASRRIRQPPASPIAPLHEAELPASAEVVSELAGALRSAASREAAERRAGARRRPPGPSSPTTATRRRMASAGATPAGGARGWPGMQPPARPSTQVPQTGTTRTAPDRAGEAGDSRDDRADVGVSRALRGTMAVQRSESSASTFVGRKAGRHGASPPTTTTGCRRMEPRRCAAVPAAAAATPPAAAEFARLSPHRGELCTSMDEGERGTPMTAARGRRQRLRRRPSICCRTCKRCSAA